MREIAVEKLKFYRNAGIFGFLIGAKLGLRSAIDELLREDWKYFDNRRHTRRSFFNAVRLLSRESLEGGLAGGAGTAGLVALTDQIDGFGISKIA